MYKQQLELYAGTPSVLILHPECTSGFIDIFPPGSALDGTSTTTENLQ